MDNWYNLFMNSGVQVWWWPGKLAETIHLVNKTFCAWLNFCKHLLFNIVISYNACPLLKLGIPWQMSPQVQNLNIFRYERRRQSSHLRSVASNLLSILSRTRIPCVITRKDLIYLQCVSSLCYL